MKKIKLYDYQQEMVENIIRVLLTGGTGLFYDTDGRKVKVGSSVMVQMPTGTGKNFFL